MELSRHEQRYKAMTILYQIKLYETNNIDYDIDEALAMQKDVDAHMYEVSKLLCR